MVRSRRYIEWQEQADPLNSTRAPASTEFPARSNRLEAARKLGWETIWANIHEDMQDAEAERAELESNLRVDLSRVDVSPEERALRIAGAISGLSTNSQHVDTVPRSPRHSATPRTAHSGRKQEV